MVAGVSQCWPLLLTEELLPAGAERACACPDKSWQFCLNAEGVVYWLGTKQPRELNVGELLVCGPGVQGELRASQIHDARLRRFCFNPTSLLGVFSLAERLELSRLPDGAMEIFPCDHRASQLVAQAMLPDSDEQNLVVRADLLHAALLALAGRITHRHDVHRPAATSDQRLHELLANAPDGELLSRSVIEIAEMCGCSVRHLNRLFRSELDCNLRTAQAEARLQRARELIEQTGARVADIARTMGYGHVGQFNASFKRLFGLTPSQCRAACFRIVTSTSSIRHDPAAE
jgi:AraC-like DNA-binding protein